MAMSFEGSLQAICKEILPSAVDFSSYNEDAEKIRNHLIEEMRKKNVAFKDAFNGLSLTDSNRNHWTNELPDEYDLHMKLNMPFKIIPREDADKPGFIILTTTPDEISHPLVLCDCISRLCLQDWIRSILTNIICDGLRLPINERIYLIEYLIYGRGYDVTHTILAKEMRYGKRKFSFDLIPAFEFHPSEWPLKKESLFANEISWLAVPFGKKLKNGSKKRPDEFSFMDCQLQWEHNVMFLEKENLRNSLRLMKAIRDVKNLDLLTNYMLKSVYLEEIKVRPDEFWYQPMGCILIKMLEALVQALRHHYLPFFHDKRFQNLSQLRKELFHLYPIQLNLILKNLRHFQKQSKVNYADIAAFSYARNNCGLHQSRFPN